MPTLSQALLLDAPVVTAALDVVATAVRTMVADALRRADGCRCHRCCAQAVATYSWSVTFMGLDNDEAPPHQWTTTTHPSLR